MSEYIDNIKLVDEGLAETFSPTFCLAKWHHTTIYMHRGQTHSCYHPKPHDITLNELFNNPSALPNTTIKKLERKEMLEGKQVSGCEYCWNVENLDKDLISDRMIRNQSIISTDRTQEILNNEADFNVQPEYIEIAFSNECNFRCGYCHPMHSSNYYKEIQKFGPYDMVKNHRCDIDWFELHDEDSQYVKAWWAWWPEVSKTLNILRITGGEPILHRTTWDLFDKLRDDPKPNLEININTNLGYASRRVEKLTNIINDLTENQKIKQFKMFTSMDTWGSRAEYLRTGLDIDLWEENQDIYLRGCKSHITHMVTFNLLSISSFKEYLKKMLEWRRLYDDVVTNNLGSHDRVRKVRFDTPYLKEPLQYDMHILPKEDFVHYFDDILQFMSDNLDDTDTKAFSQIEFERMRRVKEYFLTNPYDGNKIQEGRADFYNWFTEYDKRRDTNFLETFPEMENFYNLCKTEAGF